MTLVLYARVSKEVNTYYDKAMVKSSHASDKRKISYASRLLAGLLGVLALIIVMHLVFQFLNLNVYYQQSGQIYELSNRFDLDDESSLPTWFSQAQFLTIGLLALFAAYVQRNASAKRLWGLIAIIGLVFSIDEVATLHEHILQSIHVLFYQDASPTSIANAWWLVAPIVLFVSLWIALRMFQLFPKKTMLLYIFAGTIFIVGAVLVDLVTSASERETFLNQGVFVAIEETLELLANSIVIYAIADYLETHHGEAIKSALRQLKP